MEREHREPLTAIMREINAARSLGSLYAGTQF